MNGIRTMGRASAPRGVTVSVAGAHGADVARARDLTRAFCDGLDLPRDAEDALLLVVSELVTNALRHGGGSYVLRLTATPEAMVVEVDDGESRPPRPREPDVLRGGGFGWHLVTSLATGGVSVLPRGDGKTVRAAFLRETGVPRAA
ncbi:Histidine kinase-like ATPase domain-containing protein [Streptomyces zhaozhouensis]|uniref:Histidine kinase-like ATPase domain-containing protein n=1 Tax=Streptomyces zhaozhouensis TaxID=1300267 RepID=A0A286DSY8_9ACTN|nr:ATP-binding protein [Streptomyces zhaozhouensis]SOD61771.1 Histidine kinase-like ATPase domain-containing protein [Streptomyces zhaozhouensis]